jgi:thiol:disulfide interchange protein DsbD
MQTRFGFLVQQDSPSTSLDRRRVLGPMFRCMAFLLAMLLGAAVPVAAQEDFLEPEQAFRAELELSAQGQVLSRILSAPGYYLYRDRLQLSIDGQALGPLALPSGKRKFDETFNKEVEVYYGLLEFRADAPAGAARLASVVLSYQGCADKGLCYPPQTLTAKLALPASKGQSALAAPPSASASAQGPLESLRTLAPEAGASGPAAPAGAGGGVVSPLAAPAAQEVPSNDNTSGLGEVLASGRWAHIAGVFFLAGVLLSLTPCVLPMLPILSSIIVGQNAQEAGRWRSLGLAAAYALGMALVYSALGVAAGLAGEGLGAALQAPAVLAAFGVALAALALSMFGVYELQLPQAWSDRWSKAAQGLPGGRFVGVFFMGAVSALLVSPCVAAPLAGALIYISQTRDVWLGGSALFALAAGMSVPLLLVGASAGALLPKAGAWMESVKRFFGLLLLAVALWTVQPLFAAALKTAAWGVWLMLAAVMAWPHAQPSHHGSHLKAQFQRTVSLVAGVWAALILVGAASGGRDPWQPLALARAGVFAAPTGSGGATTSGPAFTQVKTVEALEAALLAADRTVVLDYYADWCKSCIEMEQKTYTDPAIAQRMSKALLLKVDVTANTAQDQALLKRYGLFGPPAILFFQAPRTQTPNVRMVGFEGPDAFGQTLARAGL